MRINEDKFTAAIQLYRGIFRQIESVDYGCIINTAPRVKWVEVPRTYHPSMERYMTTYLEYTIGRRMIGYFATGRGYDEKPQGGIINYPLSSLRYFTSIKTMAQMLSYGHTISGVQRTVTDPNKPRQFYYLMLDFDDVAMPIDAMLQQVHFKPSIVYNTFSHGAKKAKGMNRYRFIYVLSSPMSKTPDDFKAFYRQFTVECGVSGQYDSNCEDIARACNGTDKPARWCNATIHFDGEHFFQYNTDTTAEWHQIVFDTDSRGRVKKEERVNAQWVLNVPYTSQRMAATKTLRKWGVNEDTITLWLGSKENGYLGGFKPFLTHYMPKGDIRDYCGRTPDADGKRDVLDGSPVYTMNRCRKHTQNSHIWVDGEHRWKRIYMDGLLRRKIYLRNNGAEYADDILYLLADDWCKYFSPYEDSDHDNRQMKYGKFEFIEVFDGVMSADVNSIDADEKVSGYVITAAATTEQKRSMVGKYRWQDEDTKVADIIKNCKSIDEARGLLETFTDRTFSDKRLRKLLWGEVETETRTQQNRRILEQIIDKKKKREWNYRQCVDAGFDGSYNTFISYWKKVK